MLVRVLGWRIRESGEIGESRRYCRRLFALFGHDWRSAYSSELIPKDSGYRLKRTGFGLNRPAGAPNNCVAGRPIFGSAPRLAEDGPRATALAGANVRKAQKALSLPRGWALFL